MNNQLRQVLKALNQANLETVIDLHRLLSHLYVALQEIKDHPQATEETRQVAERALEHILKIKEPRQKGETP